MSEDRTREQERRFPSNNYTDPSGSEKATKTQATNPPVAKSTMPRVKQSEPTIGERIVNNLTDEKVKERFISDWVFPGIETLLKNLLHSVLLGIFGDKAGDYNMRRERDGNSGGPTMKYHNSNGSSSGSNDQTKGIRASTQPQLTFLRKDDAEKVLRMLRDDITNYKHTTLKNFYSYVEQATDGEILVKTSFVMTNWGWTDLSQVPIVYTGEGWLLDMPKAIHFGKENE